MATINIRRDVEDKFYRYKMPKLLAKIEGKGNGIKTVVPNMSDVSKALSRPPAYATKYFGCELGAQVKCDDKTDRYIVNGAHDVHKLQDLLDGFITKFVLCGSCLNPETDLIITKDQFIVKDCKACGKRTDVDMRHKLATYILKNPPATAHSDKYKKKMKQNGNGTGTADSDCSGSSGDEAPVEKKSSKKSKKQQKGNADDGDDNDWCEDTSPEAVAERMKELKVEGAVSKLMGDEDDDDEDDPRKQFAEYLVENPDASSSEMKTAAQNLGLKDDKVLSVLPCALFSADNVLKEISSKKKLLKTFAKNEKGQKGLIGGFEEFCGVKHRDLLAKFPLILKALYDLDLLEEEVILAWGEKVSKKYVDKKIAKELHEKAQPFLKWLKEAETDDSSDDD